MKCTVSQVGFGWASFIIILLFILTEENSLDVISEKTNTIALYKKASNHHANLPLEMYSFTL